MQIEFSEEVTISDGAEFRDDAAGVSGGAATGARALAPHLWEATLAPDSRAALVLSPVGGRGLQR